MQYLEPNRLEFYKDRSIYRTPKKVTVGVMKSFLFYFRPCATIRGGLNAFLSTHKIPKNATYTIN